MAASGSSVPISNQDTGLPGDALVSVMPRPCATAATTACRELQRCHLSLQQRQPPHPGGGDLGDRVLPLRGLLVRELGGRHAVDPEEADVVAQPAVGEEVPGV